jgi:hypothetical protein
MYFNNIHSSPSSFPLILLAVSLSKKKSTFYNNIILLFISLGLDPHERKHMAFVFLTLVYLAYIMIFSSIQFPADGRYNFILLKLSRVRPGQYLHGRSNILKE